MSVTVDQKSLSPSDPAYYAPRLPRDPDPSRLPRLGDMRQVRPPANSIADTTLDGQLEKAVFDSLRHPLDPEAIEEPPEMDRRGALLGVVGRFSAAIGAAAFVALLFVIVIPSLRQQGADPSAAEVIDSMKTALMRSDQTAKPRDQQPSPELQSILATSEARPAVSSEESEQLLKQFMQWKQKPADARQ